MLVSIMLAFIISLLLPVNIFSFKLGLGIGKEFYRPFYVTMYLHNSFTIQHILLKKNPIVFLYQMPFSFHLCNFLPKYFRVHRALDNIRNYFILTQN